MNSNNPNRMFQKPPGGYGANSSGAKSSVSSSATSNSNSKPDIVSIDRPAQLSLLQYIRGASMIRDEGWNLRDRLETIDRAYMRENDWTDDQRKAQAANKANDPTKLQNMKVPMVMESIESTVSFLSNVYLTDYPIFKFGTSPDKEEVALMWNTLVGGDQVHFGWTGELSQAFRQGAKYNIAPIEIDWKREILYKTVNGSGANGGKLEQQIWEGNSIRSIDAYNVLYDPRVPVHRVHIDGEFAGEIRQMTRVQLKLFFASLGDKRLKNDKEAFESPNWDISYYIPNLNPSVITRNRNWSDGAFNWVQWATGTAQNHIAYQNMYTVVVLYARIMPFEFGIRSINDQTPDIWKLIAVNNVLVYAQPIPNAHNYLPIVICQPLVDNIGHQTKSQGENAQPFQEMASSLWMAAQAVARRQTVDRMIYNPLLIDPDHINSPNPGAKIPIRPTAYGRKLDEAVYKIPFDSSGTELFISQAEGIAKWGMRANGQNLPTMGQFQKGNKLQNEWETTMSNANAQQRAQAIMWEAYGFAPIKEIMKSNYIQFAPGGERYNRAEKQTVSIDIQQLRTTEGDFEVGDGLLPIEKLMHADVATAAFQAMSSNPSIASAYQTGPFFSYLMELQGVDKLKDFENDPTQMAYQNALSSWTNGAIEVLKSIKEISFEDSMKYIVTILGEKPLSPEEQQAAAQKKAAAPASTSPLQSSEMAAP